MPPDQPFAHADPELDALAARAGVSTSVSILHGAVWTTASLFRETAEAIAAAAADGLLPLELEARRSMPSPAPGGCRLFPWHM
jgi:hypothetical protein